MNLAPFKLSQDEPQGKKRPCGQTISSLFERFFKGKRLRFFLRHKPLIRLVKYHELKASAHLYAVILLHKITAYRDGFPAGANQTKIKLSL